VMIQGIFIIGAVNMNETDMDRVVHETHRSSHVSGRANWTVVSVSGSLLPISFASPVYRIPNSLCYFALLLSRQRIRFRIMGNFFGWLPRICDKQWSFAIWSLQKAWEQSVSQVHLILFEELRNARSRNGEVGPDGAMASWRNDDCRQWTCNRG
jgi:hypothetical protein